MHSSSRSAKPLHPRVARAKAVPRTETDSLAESIALRKAQVSGARVKCNKCLSFFVISALLIFGATGFFILSI